MQAIMRGARDSITRACEFVMKPMYASRIDVRPAPCNRRQGQLVMDRRAYPCALGRGGVGVRKREGDGATPAGMFLLRRCWVRSRGSAPVVTGLPVRRTRPLDGWCDDPKDARYNRPVALPFSASHERMWRDDALYDLVIEIGWNDSPPRRGHGSAIFMHVARPGFAPTEGCIALRPQDLKRLLARVGPRTKLHVHR
jgi:L,D-peptidoglycan transpeptidase YkuD (ErfK/YbiS/YcfS/YnhG family)